MKLPTESKRVLVTGAGSDSGAAIAARLATAGHEVWGTVRSAAKADALNASKDKGQRLLLQTLELSGRSSIDALAQRAADWRVDVLINNAGFSLFGAQELLTDEQLQLQFQVNVFGPLQLTRRLIPTLQQRRGTDIWIGSMMNYAPLPIQGANAASRSAVAALSDSLALELEPQGVRVFCIEPGDLATELPAKRCIVEHVGHTTKFVQLITFERSKPLKDQAKTSRASRFVTAG